MGLNDINGLSHTRWNCKYHIVFAPKYCRKVFYQEKKAAIGKILRQLWEWKGVKIIEAEACPNHIHLFIEIPPKMLVANFKGSRTEQLLMVFCKQTKLRYNELTEEEKQWLTRIVQKSELAKSYVPQRGKENDTIENL